MDRYEVGMLAVSRAGHDRGRVYAIVGEEQDYVYLCDGKGRPVDAPKKKNKKHIQLIRQIPPELASCARAGEAFGNEAVSVAIRRYIKENRFRREEGCQNQT